MYTLNKANSKRVRCLETGETIESAAEAGRRKGIYSEGITRSCKRKLSAGKDENGNPLHWEYA